MMPCRLLGALSAAVIVQAAGAGIPTVEIRIVERTGQLSVAPGDNVLDFAVQARVNGSCLGGFAFDAIRIVGEPESGGLMQRAFISNADGTYSSAITTSGMGGRVGLASAYKYYATINASFNGTINVSAGTFTNTPDQEIGLVLGSARSGGLLGVPGLDADEDGNPDTWSGNGGPAPQTPVFAPLNPTLAGPYFGKDEFIDVYRFRYTVTNLSPRLLHFEFVNPAVYTFDNLVGNLGDWSSNNVEVLPANRTVGTLDVPVMPGPGGAGVVMIAGVLAARRRR